MFMINSTLLVSFTGPPLCTLKHHTSGIMCLVWFLVHYYCQETAPKTTSIQLTVVNAHIVISLTGTACERKAGMDFEPLPTQIPPTGKELQGETLMHCIVWSCLMASVMLIGWTKMKGRHDQSSMTPIALDYIAMDRFKWSGMHCSSFGLIHN